MVGNPLTDNWRARGHCTKADPDLFMPETTAAMEEALEYCEFCPVLRECRDWAETLAPPLGVIGGKFYGTKPHVARTQRARKVPPPIPPVEVVPVAPVAEPFNPLPLLPLATPLSPQREIEKDAFQRLMRITREFYLLGQADRESREFKHKAGGLAEAIEIWRAAEWSANQVKRQVA